MRLGLGIWHLFDGASGVERVMTDIARAMLERGHEVTVIAKTRPAGKPESGIPLSPLPDRAEVMELEVASPGNLKDAKARLAESGLDVILSMSAGPEHMLFPWLLAGSGIPLAAAEAHYPAGVANRRWNAYEYYAALAAADSIQVLLEPYRDQLPKALRRRVAVIGNPAPVAREVDWRARAERKRRVLLGLGRFDETDKRFSILIRAWEMLAADFPDWSLTLVGDGPSRPVYESLVDGLALRDRTSLPGAVDADGVDAHYAGADVFCMPSRQEGFGLVLAEAAAWSLPLVGVGSCTAAACLIPPGAGALADADSPAALAKALRPILAAAPEERRAMGEAARDAFGRFAPDTVFDEWEALLRRTAARRGRTRLDRALLERWTPGILREGTLDLVSRADPMRQGEDDLRSPEALTAKLRASHQALEREYGHLTKKYGVLLSEYQALAARAGGAHGGIKKGKRR